MGKIYSESETIATIAKNLIPGYHPELATARLKYAFVDKGSTKSGRPVLGKARKLSGISQFFIDCDFIIEVAEDTWNELTENKRTALVDHLLEHCTGEEDDKTGDMVWVLRTPDVEEFTSILRRHGAWNETLSAFASVAKAIEIEDMVDDIVMSSSEGESATAH
jgi:hypothetical protein